jgi:hypothetical protein
MGVVHWWLAIALRAGPPRVLFRLANVAFHSLAVFASGIAAFDKFGELLWSSGAAMPGKGILRQKGGILARSELT